MSTTEFKVKYTIMWIVLAPLIVMSWIGAIIAFPFWLIKQGVDKLRSKR